MGTCEESVHAIIFAATQSTLTTMPTDLEINDQLALKNNGLSGVYLGGFLIT